MTEAFDIVIAGGGHAGAQTAIALRKGGFSGSLAIVEQSLDLPYERPPLSKDYLLGTREWDSFLLRRPEYWVQQAVEMRLGRRINGLDPVGHILTCEGGFAIRYRKLVWALGGRGRPLSCQGHDLAGVHSIRDRADVDRLREERRKGARVVVIGGGYIGLEAASVLIKLGCRVVLLETQNRLLTRVAGPCLSGFLANEHRAHGVDLRLDAKVACIEGEAGRACGVRLADGSLIPADLVIVGIGILPNVEVALAAGAEGDNGLRVDATGATSLRDVYAAGDCALHANPHADGAWLRLESIQNANDMAANLARTLLGSPSVYEALPWFWSDQYDLKLQTVGLSIGYDEEVLRGAPEARTFSVVYKKQGRVIAIDCINSPKDFVQGRELVQKRMQVDSALMLDTNKSLREIARS